MAAQEQIRLQTQIKALDDVFHNVIIALERLERFVDYNNTQQAGVATAIGSDRDLHDDVRNPPSVTSMHLEMQTQCLALFFQTKFDKTDDRYRRLLRYFIGDLLSWYGGREGRQEPNDVEKYSLPILAALDRFAKTPIDISTIIKQHIIDIEGLSSRPDDEKEQGITDGFRALILAQDIVDRRMKAFLSLSQDAEVECTAHVRGTKEAGLSRLIKFYITAFQDKAPLRRLLQSTLDVYPEYTSDSIGVLIDSIYEQHYVNAGQENGMESENGTDNN
jgi:hypothetical protein